MIQASSSGVGRPTRPPAGPRHVSSSPSPTTAQTPASVKICSARAGGIVGVHRDIRRAGGERAEDRHVEVRVPARDADADAIAGTDAAVAQAIGELLHLLPRARRR